MPTSWKARLVGINHVAIEVTDVDEALRFYSEISDFKLRRSHRSDNGQLQMAFIDMGDQFLAISRGRSQDPDRGRHFGLVVDDRSTVMERAQVAGAKILERAFNFRDPWGNHIEIVAYRDVQFTKTTEMIDAMGLTLDKGKTAREEIARKTK